MITTSIDVKRSEIQTIKASIVEDIGIELAEIANLNIELDEDHSDYLVPDLDWNKIYKVEIVMVDGTEDTYHFSPELCEFID